MKVISTTSKCQRGATFQVLRNATALERFVPFILTDIIGKKNEKKCRNTYKGQRIASFKRIW